MAPKAPPQPSKLGQKRFTPHSINVAAMFDDLADRIQEALDANMEQLFDGLQRIADLEAERSAAV
jgi:hypothetical protein